MAEPEKLKYLLCPVVAQGRADQERFYDLFDQYWAEISEPWQMPEPPEKPEEEPPRRLPEWLPWAIAGLMILGMGTAAYFLISQPEPKPLSVFFRHVSKTPGKVKVGDTLHLENLSENYDTAHHFEWKLMTGETVSSLDLEHVDSHSHDLIYPIDTLVGSPYKHVILRHSGHFEGEGKHEHTYDFSVHCPDPPVFDSIFGEKDFAEKVDEAVFRAVLLDTVDVGVTWDFDGALIAPNDPNWPADTLGFEVKNYFPIPGPFEIKARAVRRGRAGICEAEITHRINVGREKAFLAAKPLYLDHVDPLVNFSWGTWGVLALLGLAMIFYWVKWAMRKAPADSDEEEEDDDLTSAAQRFAAPDKGPYFIPFRSQEGHIRVDKDLYRLADVMRQRQEGLRKEMDVPASVKKTIAGGGFPRLLTQVDTVPTEYLFLLDERSHNGHQGRLFEFMVNFLREREVIGEIFYFNQRLHSFWNDDYPGGLSPEKLYRLHPGHRVVLLSDAHALISPAPNPPQPSRSEFGTGSQRGGGGQLRPEAIKLFSQWKDRLLLTPLPLVSWTWREKALYQLFPIFPTHTGGLAEAAKYLERGMDEEEMRPTYASWCEWLAPPAPPSPPNRGGVGLAEKVGPSDSAERTPPLLGGAGGAGADVNYRRWRTAADHADYLKDYPKLFLWLCSLAVYPKPDWSITLAIGKALAPLGVKVEYDGLLILSRIPWLVKGELSPRLRRELLADLDPEAERLAREAVRNEMQAVKALVKGSHANREHQIELALQGFAIAPQNAENQELVRKMLALGLLSPRQVAQLNQQVSPGSKERSAAPVKAFLEKNKTETEAPEKPFFTPDFYRASLATLLYLVLFGLVWKFGGTPELCHFLGEDSSPTLACEEEDLHAYFFKKECVADSAVLLNNRAVEAWQFTENTKRPPGSQEERSAWSQYAQNVNSLFTRALELRPDYALAKSNFLKFNYNLGVKNYNDFVADSVGINSLYEAQANFRAARADSLISDALHALGLTHFYDYRAKMSSEQMEQLEIERRVMFPNGASTPEEKKRMEEWEKMRNQTIDSAQVFYGEIMALDEAYFDSLETYPHLQSLLFKSQAGWLSIKVAFVDEGNGRPLNGVTVISDGLEERVREDTFYLGMFLGERRDFEFQKRDYATAGRSVRMGVEGLSFTVGLESTSTPDDNVVPGDTPPADPEAIKKLEARLEEWYDGWFVEVLQQSERFPQQRQELSKRMAEVEERISKIRGLLDLSSSELAGKEIENLISEYDRILRMLKNESDVLGNRVTDNDGDGVGNDDDACPDFPGEISNNGCPLYKVVGFVLNEKDELLEGVTVKWSGVELSTVTDPKGAFNISITDGLSNTLEFSLSGYAKSEIEIDALGQMEVVLKKFETPPEYEVYNYYFKVTDMVSGKALEGVTVRFDDRKTMQTDEGGLVELESRTWVRRVEVLKAGYLSKTIIEPGPDDENVELWKESDFPITEMIRVRGGSFEMGCDKKYDGKCEDDELPVHEVRLDDFYIGKYEVTQKLWEAVMGSNPSRFNDCPKCPVESVTWYDVQEFLEKLNQLLPGRNFRLPTEAEWEYAARGGSLGKRYRYAGSNDLNNVGWYFENSGRKTHPVGQKQANELGLYDMSGNVYEWCSDWYQEDYYGQFIKQVADNPKGPSGEAYIVLRGGSWDLNGENSRIVSRGYGFPDFFPDETGYRDGFRLAQD